MSILNNQERLDLNKLIKANDTEDCTESIRKNKQSSLIRTDVKQLIYLKQKYSRLMVTNPNEFDSICINQCRFLFNNYTDIFNKIKKGILNLEIFEKFLNILKQIEDSEINQHEASYLVGKYLKELYVDSALKNQELIDNKNAKNAKNAKKEKKPIVEKKISYKDFKLLQNSK
jgi:hypothetical protein